MLHAEIKGVKWQSIVKWRAISLALLVMVFKYEKFVNPKDPEALFVLFVSLNGRTLGRNYRNTIIDI